MNKKLTQIIFVLLMLAASISQAQVDTFTVTKTTDFDPFLYQDNPDDTAIVGTLQWAVRKANDAINPCLIIFNIPGNGEQTINLIYQLPSLNNEITIDATTQTGYAQWNPAIIINGANAIQNCFIIANNNCRINGCYIQNFISKGIFVINVNGFTIENNVINRIVIPPPSPLKPCVIPASGIALNNCTNGVIRANIIGTDVSLSTGLEIRDWGIWSQGITNYCLIGGNSIDDGNIIAFCKAGINRPSGCMQYRKNRFLNNDKSFANISNRCAELLMPVSVLFDTYTSNGFTSGTAHQGSTVDIFGSDDSNNAIEFLAFAIADNNGFWSANVSTQYPFLVGIETDINNCSSILSDDIEQTVTPGSTCTASTLLPPATYTCSSTNFQIADTVFWMSFTADTTSMRIAIQNPTNTPAANIQKLILYSGTCGTLQEIARRDVNVGDMLDITRTDFVIGETYLAKAVQEQATQGWLGACNRMIPFGGVCNSAINIIPDTTYNTLPYTMSDTAMWFKFHTDSTFVKVLIRDTLNILSTISLLSGDCNSLVNTTTVDVTTQTELDNGMRIIYLANLTQNADYFIKVKGQEPTLYRLSLNIISKESNPEWPIFSCSDCTYSNLTWNGDFTTNQQTFSTGYTWITVAETYTNVSDDNNIFIHDNLPPVYSVWNAVSSYNSNFLICDCHGLGNIWCNLIDVQQNTDYYFSFNAKNLDNEDDPIIQQGDWHIPKIQVSINGEINSNLGSNGSIALPRTNIPNKWVQVCGVWNSGTFSGLLYFCIKNNSSNDVGGNNIGIDNIIFGKEIPNNFAMASPIICNGESVTLTAPFIYSSYLWSNGSTSQAITLNNLSSGSYTYTVTGTSQSGCTNVGTTNVIVNALPVVTLCSFSNMCPNSSPLPLTCGLPAGGTYSGTGVSAGIFNPSIGAGTYTITYTYTDGNGCVNSASSLITVNSAPTVTFSGNNPICSGQGTEICINSINGGTAPYIYQWFGNSGLNYSNQCFITGQLLCTDPIPCSSYSYWVSVTDANGCTNTGSTIITINPLPVVTAPPQTICSGKATSITPYSNLSGTTYSWTVVQTTWISGASNGSGSTIAQTLTNSGTTAGTATYTITPTVNGCDGTPIIVVVTVYPAVIVNLQQIPDDLCQTVNIIATPSTGLNYSWDIIQADGDPINYPFNTPSFSGGLSLTTTFNIIATDPLTGCTGTDVFVASPYPPFIVSAGSDVNKCANDPAVQLTATGGGSYLWSNGSTNASITVNPTINTGYTVTVTNSFGCSKTDAVVVIVNPIPIVNLGYNQTICSGTTVTLTATGGGTYLWNNGATTPSITVNPTNNTGYQVTVTNIYICSAIDAVAILVKQLPAVQLSNISVCQGQSGVLTAITSGSMVNVINYLWSNGVNGSTASSISVNTGGLYSVTVTGSNGCFATTQAIVNLISSPPPVPQIMIPQTCIADGEASTFSYSLPFGTFGTYNQSWNFGDGSSASNNPNHSFASHGYHSITLTLSNQCGGTTTVCSPVFVNPNVCVCNIQFDEVNDKILTQADNQYFSTTKKINSTITIQNGANIVISADQIFGPKGRIIVERGAILTLQVLKELKTDPSCLYMWQGVEVHGYPNYISTQLSPQQGKFIMLNESVIENAHIGVLLGARTNYSCNIMKPFNANFAGGIIQIPISAHFPNNGIGIKFLAKTNTDDQLCNITKGYFTCTGTLYDSYYSTGSPLPYPNIHNPWAGFANLLQRTDVGIYLHKVSNPIIASCVFNNTEFGIKSLNAKYDVTGIGTSFTKHVVGIYIDNTMSNPGKHTIDQATFDFFPTAGSVKPAAIYINAGLGDEIKKCKFGDEFYGTQNDNILGISMKNTSGFRIYDNKFYNFTTGIRVYNSGTGGGDIGPFDPPLGAPPELQQRNIFNKCKTGVATSADNSGLLVYCNNFENTNLAQTDYLKCINNSGTLMNQGNSSKAIGDKYLYIPMKDVNSLTVPFNYYWNGIQDNYLPNVNSNVYPYYVSNTPKCRADWYDPLTTAMNLQMLDQLKNNIAQLRQSLTALIANLDHGNTQSLLQAVNSNMPNGQLKNTLLNNSPLSDTVLISVIKKTNALPPGIFKNVMMPNLPVSRNVLLDFMSKLSTLPSGIANQLKAAYFINQGVTTSTTLQRQIEQLQYERNMLLAYTINLYLEAGAVDSVILLLESEGTVEAKQKLVSYYMDTDNLMLAQSRLNEIQAANQDLTDWKNLFVIFLNLANAGKTLQELDSAQLAFINDLAYKCPANLAVSNAQGILSLLYGTLFQYCDDAGNSFARMSQVNENEFSRFENSPLISVKTEYLGANYPNPFDGSTNIPYFLNEGRKGILKIYNDKGILLKTIKVSDGENVIKFETNNWGSGIYFYTLEVDNISLSWNKMVLIK